MLMSSPFEVLSEETQIANESTETFAEESQISDESTALNAETADIINVQPEVMNTPVLTPVLDVEVKNNKITISV